MKTSFLLLLVGLVMSSQAVFAHSGGTDANGCHAGTKTYHCHNRK